MNLDQPGPKLRKHSVQPAPIETLFTTKQVPICIGVFVFYARWSACAESCEKTWTRLDLSVPKCASDHPVIDGPTRAPARPALEGPTRTVEAAVGQVICQNLLSLILFIFYRKLSARGT